jgi:glycerophosphoryl diester phosphodiesterase
VYIVEEGRDRLGDTVAVRVDGTVFSLYAVRNVTFAAGAGGGRADSALFIGVWRGVTGPDGGRFDLVAPAEEGGKELVEGKGSGRGLVLAGTLSIGSTRHAVRLRKLGAIKARLRGFQIIAHRGGGRNSERLGMSENSIPMIRLATLLGATGVEIDVQMTKDGIPIVFHDPTFTARTVPSPYVIGPVENYTLVQMRAAARLVNGEQIPTLREALRAVIDSTTLTLVWVDNKQVAVVDSVLVIQKEMMDYARLRGRNDLRILFGIPADDIRDAYERSPHKEGIPLLCELDVETAKRLNADVWAPRFTAGIPDETTVRDLERAGIEIYVWTLDDESFIRQYLASDAFDGILTNYPTLLAALFYTRAVEP